MSRELIEPCAQEILDVVPQIMQSIRCAMRKSRATDLSVPQLRVLAFLNRRPGSPLHALADHLGLTSPSAFSLVEGLLAKGLVDREESARDRRAVSLHLTPAGAAALQQASQGAHSHIAELLSSLDEADLAAVRAAMQALRPLVSPQPAVVKE